MSLIMTSAQLADIVSKAQNNAGVCIYKKSGPSTEYYAVLSYKVPFSMVYITTTSTEVLEDWIDNGSHPQEIKLLTDDKSPAVSGGFDVVYYDLLPLQQLMMQSSNGKVVFSDQAVAVSGHPGTFASLKAQALASSTTLDGLPSPPPWP